MFDRNVPLVFDRLLASDLVLDVGSWGSPFNRADYVLDVMPYETRGLYGHQGPTAEHFSKETWINHDVCSTEPWPFQDKFFDFSICSHLLEDVRDPLRVCSELIRVSKRGYIETPSRIVESIMGAEGPNFAGYSHHRWFVEMNEDHVTFRFKTHRIHSHWKFHFPRNRKARLRPEETVSFMFWEGGFRYREIHQTSSVEIDRELETFIRGHGGYDFYHRALDRLNLRPLARKIFTVFPALKPVALRMIGIKSNAAEAHEFHQKNPDVPLK